MKGARQIQPAVVLRPVTNQDDIEPTGLRTARSQRIGRALEPDRLVSQCRQFFLIPQQTFLFAFDDQNRFAAPKRQHLRPDRCDTGRRRRGQPYFEAASLPRFAVDTDGSIMVTNDFANSCQPEAGSRQASREKWLEHSPRHALIKAAPVVADSNADIAARRKLAVAHLQRSGQLFLLRGYADTTAALHRLRGIGAQIEDDLLQLRGLARYGEVNRDVFKHKLDAGG